MDEYLIDSNVLIDYLSNSYPENGSTFLENIMYHNTGYISNMTLVEVLGYNNFSPERLTNTVVLCDQFVQYPINDAVIQEAITIRQITTRRVIKGPDSIIAATARLHNLPLITRNIRDFTGLDIPLLNLHNL